MPPANHNKTTSRPRKIGDQIGPGGLRGSNLFAHVETLQALLQRDQPDLLRPFEQQLSEFGSWVRSVVDSQAEYRDAQAQPRLESYDRRGNTINRVQHNPHCVQCQRELYKRGLVASGAGATRPPT